MGACVMVVMYIKVCVTIFMVEQQFTQVIYKFSGWVLYDGSCVKYMIFKQSHDWCRIE